MVALWLVCGRRKVGEQQYKEVERWHCGAAVKHIHCGTTTYLKADIAKWHEGMKIEPSTKVMYHEASVSGRFWHSGCERVKLSVLKKL